MSAYMAHTPASHPWFSSQCKRKRGVDGYDSNFDDPHGQLDGMGLWPSSVGGMRLSTRPLPSSSTLPQVDNLRAVKKSRKFDGSSVVSRRDMENEFASLSIVGGTETAPILAPNYAQTEPAIEGWISSSGFGTEGLLSGSSSTATRTPNYQTSFPVRTTPGDDATSLGVSNEPSPSNSQLGLFDNSTSLPRFVEVPEVSMRTRSWYEPEKDRIVILDLNASDTESDVENSDQQPPTPTSDRYNSSRFANLVNPAESAWEVSNAYLSKISTSSARRTNSLGLDFTLPLHDPSLGALVLFKGPGVPGKPSEEEDGPELYAHIDEVVDDDDVDMGSAPGTGCGTPMEVDEMEFD